MKAIYKFSVRRCQANNNIWFIEFSSWPDPLPVTPGLAPQWHRPYLETLAVLSDLTMRNGTWTRPSFVNWLPLESQLGLARRTWTRPNLDNWLLPAPQLGLERRRSIWPILDNWLLPESQLGLVRKTNTVHWGSHSDRGPTFYRWQTWKVAGPSTARRPDKK